MWWTFKNALVRKVAYVLVGLAAAFLFAHKSHATTYMYPQTTYSGQTIGPYATATAYCQAVVQVDLTLVGVTSATLTSVTPSTGPGPGQPTGTGQTENCNITTNGGSANTTTPGSVVSTLSCSSSSGNLDLLNTLGGSSGYTATGAFCYQGCEYANGNNTLQVGTSTNRFAGQAVPTGNVCGVSGNANQAPAQNATCQLKAGATTCADGTNSRALVQPTAGGTFSIVAANTPATVNTCESFADGGVVCNAGTGTQLQTPPAPSTAGGALATPTVTVTTTATGNQIDYFPPSVVSASQKNVGVTNPSGVPLQNGTTSTAASSGGSSGSATPSAANGDCAASSVNCSGDGTLPTLATEPTAASSLSTYYTALQSVPIVSAVNGITTAFSGTASCTTFDFSMFSHTYTMDEHCTIINGIASTLGAIMLAVYTLTAFRIVLST
jgi:hypothetical protein